MTHRIQAGRMLAAVAIALAAIGARTASAQADAAPVAVERAEREPIVNVVRLSGSVVAPRSARVSAAVGGLVERVRVALGDRVDKGDTLVDLNADLARHEAARARAALAEARAELADAERRVRIAERLVERDNMPANELQARKADARIAEARVQRLKAEAARARTERRRHTVDAPFAGVVAAKATERGEWVEPGDTLVKLVNTERLYVDVPVPQRYFRQLRGGPTVTVTFDAYPERAYSARVAARVPVSDPTARTFTLRLNPAPDAIALTPGMSARVTLRLTTGTQGVTVPRDGVIRHPDGRTTVWTIEQREGDGTTVAERAVDLGRAFDGRVHVREGLEAGTRVVTRGNEALRPGQRVRIIGGES